MYKVIIVDDEPVARGHIKLALQKKCENFCVVGEFENGVDALEAIREEEPDIVITDVQMPVMDGIELVTKICEQSPDIITILVSGYGEFEYAKEAIKSGVKDYLLKPIAPADIEKTMLKVEKLLDGRYFQNRKNIMHKIAKGKVASIEEIKKYFPEKEYKGCLLRKNGVPRRFFASADMEILSDNHEIFFVYGRDDMEELFLYPKNLDIANSCEEFGKKMLESRKNNSNYVTVIFSEYAFRASEFQGEIRKFYKALDTKVRIGHSQVLSLEEIQKHAPLERKKKKDALERIEYYFSQARYIEVKEEIDKQFDDYEKDGYTQLEMEMEVRKILWALQKYDKQINGMHIMETMIEDIFFSALNIQEVKEILYEELFQDKDEQMIHKANSKEFFQVILKYMDENLEKPLSLQSICKDMGISQTYLSKQFRKNTGMSFGNHLTQIRMEKAKKLMREVSDIYVKDVANLVGYNDQFYFSKVFRSYAGKSPSEYFTEISKTQ